jgi:ankyrin repeat protein
MALHEQNRMFQILHKNGVSRKHIGTIMNDLKGSGIFDEEEIEEDIDWDLIDQESHVKFDDFDPKEIEKVIDDIKQKQAQIREIESSKLRSQFLYEAEMRVRAKMKEMEEKGLTGPDVEIDVDVESKPVEQITTRYGRSPLHEAIAMKDICLVKKYVRKNLYLTSVDNNGHKPVEMAFYEGYEEAIVVFDAYQSKK